MDICVEAVIVLVPSLVTGFDEGAVEVDAAGAMAFGTAYVDALDVTASGAASLGMFSGTQSLGLVEVPSDTIGRSCGAGGAGSG